MDIDLKKFFVTDNLSGWKCVSSKLKNNELAIFDHVCLWSKENGFESLIFKEQVYLCINSHLSRPVCCECNGIVKYKNITLGYQSFCSIKCSNKNTDKIEVTKQAVILKYNVDNVNQLESVKDKRTATNMRLYGVENAFEREDVKLKTKVKMIELYGYERPFDSMIIRNKIKGDKTSTIEKVICGSLKAIPKFIFKNKEYDMILGNFIIEVNGEYWHQDKIENLSLSQMNNIINDYIKIKALEGSDYILLNVRPNAVKGKKITLELIEELSYQPKWFIDETTVIMTKEYLLHYLNTHDLKKLKKQFYLFKKLLGIFHKEPYSEIKLKEVVGCFGKELINDLTIENIT